MLLPETLTTFVPSTAGSSNERRHDAEERLLQADLDDGSQAAARLPAMKT